MKFRLTFLLLAFILLSPVCVIPSSAQLRSSTNLTISPSKFEIRPGGSIVLTATLTSDGKPLANKTLVFTAPLGSISPLSGKTDSNGQIKANYTAPKFETTVKITVAFAGDLKYKGSEAASTGEIVKAPTTLEIDPANFTVQSGETQILIVTLSSEGEPLSGKRIEFTATPGIVTPNVGTTDQEGKVTVEYSAPKVTIRTSARITACFLGDFEYKGSNATSTGTIEVEAGVLFPKVVMKGASFTIPESMKGNITDYISQMPEEVRNKLPFPIPTTGFFIVSEENLFLVLANRCDKGFATVEGWTLPVNISLNGKSFNVILAENVSIEKDGEPATLSEVLANPENYTFKLVKISAFRSQVSIIYDPDDGSTGVIPITLGFLTEQPENVTELIRNAIRKGRSLIENPSITILENILREKGKRLPLFNYDEYGYWMRCLAETDGIVLPSSSQIMSVLQLPPAVKSLIQHYKLPILYDVKTSLEYENVSSIMDVKENPERFIGKVICLSSNGVGGTISIQESVREATGEEIPADILLEGMIAWNNLSLPPEREELLALFGACNMHQDAVINTSDGVFRYVGRIVSASQVDDSLPPDMLALVIYQKKRIGDINYEALAESAKEQIESKLKEAYFVLTNFMENPPSNIPAKPPERVINPQRSIDVASPEDLPKTLRISVRAEIHVRFARPNVPIGLAIENSTISRLELRLKEAQSNLNITIEKLAEKPPELPKPEGHVWAYIEISVEVPDEAIDEAKIEFWLPKEWIQTHGAASDEVALLRYYGGEWHKLSTEIVGENSTHIRYAAETPGFSTFAITLTAKAAAPSFHIKRLTVVPAEVSVGENVTINVEVENLGDKKGEYTVNLYINGTLEASKTVVLDARENTTVMHTTSRDAVGTYLVEVGGLQESFKVVKASTILSIKASESKVVKGNTIVISGSIEPAVPEAAITITFTKPDGSTFNKTVTTDSQGAYSYSYTPTETGSWNVKASWKGDTEHEGSVSSSISFTVEEKSGCIIATATYGSELSPQVQFLREFRDRLVLKTFAGANFMTAFNTWYYSFSPTIAPIIASNDALRTFMKILLYPLINILHLSSAIYFLLSFSPEFAIVTAGLVASSLIGLVYFLPLPLIICLTKKVTIPKASIESSLLLLSISTLSIIIAEITKISILMMTSTALFVLTTISFTVLISIKQIISKKCGLKLKGYTK